MSEQVLRSNPSTISTTLKEAVVDSLVNLTYAQISGHGSTGQYIFGARPRTVLNSGFLLPQKELDGDDEVTSPIWVSSHGLDLQVGAEMRGTIVVQPMLSLYVRVLPTEEDLKRPNCKATFTLRPALAKELNTERRKRLEEEWEKVKGQHTSRTRHPEWKAIRERITQEVYAARGIPRLLSDLNIEEPGEALPNHDDTPILGVEVAAVPAVPALPQATPLIRDDHFEPLTVPHKWMRLGVELPTLELDLSKSKAALLQDVEAHAIAMNEAINNALRAWARSNDPDKGGQAWGYRAKLLVPPSKYRRWDEFLALARGSMEHVLALPKIELGWDFDMATNWRDQSKRNVRIALENKSKEPRQYTDETDPAVFQVSLRVALPESLHRPLRLERVKPSYRYNQYLQYPAIGHNAGVQVVSRGDGAIALLTTWTPRYTQPRIVPTAAAKVQRNIRALSKPDCLGGLLPVVDAMENWLSGLPGKVNLKLGLDPKDAESLKREEDAFEKDLARWAAEKDAIRAGLEVLKESREAWKLRGPQADRRAIPFEAWLAMNEAMANFMKVRFRNDDGRNEWRLFQLAFILANITSLVSRMPEFKRHFVEHRDDSVTLLYFATGGGKSEAFFGLLAFNLLLDRLRGKQTGVTAMIRYPLRLLTIQQAQRCAKVLAQVELVRRKNSYGGQPLSIGFWVGSGGSPNRHSSKGVRSIPEIEDKEASWSVEKTLLESDQYSAAARAWNKIPVCPFCGEKTALRRFRALGGTLAHVCTDLKCAANEGKWRPLPFYICDEDIYDLAPSVLLGTVDKLALIGHSSATIRRIYGMFGAAPWFDPTTSRLHIPQRKELRDGPSAKGMEGIYPAYKNTGTRLFEDPFPSLIIQDEAHLLDESLGSFAGLFESTLDAVFAHLSKSLLGLVAISPSGQRRRAKVVAASATVSEPERQLEHLYQRAVPAVQFPFPGPSLYESFYAEPELADETEASRRALDDIELKSKQARLYCAFMTNGKPHTATSVAVLSGFHLCITRLFTALTSGVQSEADGAKSLLLEYVSDGPLQSLHRDTLSRASAADVATVVDLHRIALTYVTNKKGGDQIMSAEAEETRKRHLNEGIELPSLDTRLITGSVDQGEIQQVVQAAQKRDKAGEPFTPLSEALRSVIATSAISHGVDVEEFNSMFFAGMPFDIAEYIQASSRVGRTHVGFVVLIPTPQRRRDRHIVQVFDIFHRFLERMVQPAAIDRWAEKAVERVYPSLLQAYITGVVPSRQVIDLDESDKAQAPDFSFVPELRAEFRKRREALIADINRFIELAVGLRDGYEPEGADHYRQFIDTRTRTLLTTLDSDLWGSGPLQGYFDAQSDPMNKPMTSLRDVDQGGRIQMASRSVSTNPEERSRNQRSADVVRVMDLIRLGTAQSGEGEEQ